MIQPKPSVKRANRVVDTQDRGDFVCLDRNERVPPFPHDVMTELIAQISPEDLSQYPILEPFYHKLSAWLGIERDWLLLSNGSDGAIRSVFEVYINPGDQLILPCPTYAMYTVYAGLFDAAVLPIHYNRNFSSVQNRSLKQ